MIKEENDSILMWNGERCEPEETPVIETYEDHRMAMAFAPAIIRHPNLLIADPQVVTKSYPGYWEDLKHTRISGYKRRLIFIRCGRFQQIYFPHQLLPYCRFCITTGEADLL